MRILNESGLISDVISIGQAYPSVAGSNNNFAYVCGVGCNIYDTSGQLASSYAVNQAGSGVAKMNALGLRNGNVLNSWWSGGLGHYYAQGFDVSGNVQISATQLDTDAGAYTINEAPNSNIFFADVTTSPNLRLFLFNNQLGMLANNQNFLTLPNYGYGYALGNAIFANANIILAWSLASSVPGFSFVAGSLLNGTNLSAKKSIPNFAGGLYAPGISDNYGLTFPTFNGGNNALIPFYAYPNSSSSTSNIYGTIIDSRGNIMVPPFQINQGTGGQFPSGTSLPNGDVFVMWQGNDNKFYGQALTAAYLGSMLPPVSSSSSASSSYSSSVSSSASSSASSSVSSSPSSSVSSSFSSSPSSSASSSFSSSVSSSKSSSASSSLSSSISSSISSSPSCSGSSSYSSSPSSSYSSSASSSFSSSPSSSGAAVSSATASVVGTGAMSTNNPFSSTVSRSSSSCFGASSSSSDSSSSAGQPGSTSSSGIADELATRIDAIAGSVAFALAGFLVRTGWQRYKAKGVCETKKFQDLVRKQLELSLWDFASVEGKDFCDMLDQLKRGVTDSLNEKGVTFNLGGCTSKQLTTIAAIFSSAISSRGLVKLTDRRCNNLCLRHRVTNNEEILLPNNLQEMVSDIIKTLKNNSGMFTALRAQRSPLADRRTSAMELNPVRLSLGEVSDFSVLNSSLRVRASNPSQANIDSQFFRGASMDDAKGNLPPGGLEMVELSKKPILQDEVEPAWEQNAEVRHLNTGQDVP